MTHAKTEKTNHVPWFAKAGAACSIVPISRFIGSNIFALKGGGYTTRLFLQQAIPGRGANWSSHVVLGRPWWTWSWNQVPASLRPAEILAEHLRGLR